MPFSGVIRGLLKAGAVVALPWALLSGLIAADIDLERTRGHYLSGNYAACIHECEAALGEGLRNEEWSLLLAQSRIALGLYPHAKNTILDAIEKNRGSIRLRILAHSILTANGNHRDALQQLAEINELGGTRIWNYRDPVNLVALGRAALLLGADPKLVLDRFFDAARKADPLCRDAWIASGDLALEKQDFALAATLYADAARQFPTDPAFQLGLARAFAPSDRPRAIRAIEAALELNTRHVPSMILLAELAIDSEDYAAADALVDKSIAVNPWSPEAWACRAVLKQLQEDPRAAAQARSNALRYWDTNPAVDYRIGRKLSQNYRFKEGAQHQRQALQFDPAFLPARLQLAQDLLRLGDDLEGWELAREVQELDAYDVTAYNLATLHDTLSTFATITNEHFIVRMSPHEANLYGHRVLNLLERARLELLEKYQITLERPTTIEIFPDQKDFGVRTFGMPHNPGFLGVCFGHVVTANSPASQSQPSNWEAVLWHEFVHVVTLQITRNKMPRWLSEGLSVYEERLANPAWGQHMDPRYREMILNGELTPIGKLSGAFLAPKTPLHIQFAYFQSSLVAEFLVDAFGWNTMLAILRDLGDGVTINDALITHTLPLDQLEKKFDAHARQLALSMAPGLDWERPPGFRTATPTPNAPDDRFAERYGDSPLVRVFDEPAAQSSRNWTDARLATNFWALRKSAETSISTGRLQEARQSLELLIREYPAQRGPNNAHAMLAHVHRSLNETALERTALERWAELDADALDAYRRLMILAADANDWNAVMQNANRFLAVNPLLAQPFLHLAQASEQLNQPESAIQAWQKVLAAGAPDPAEAHYRLARLLHNRGDPGARRHVLESLERAPRFRSAHALLLELQPASRRNANPPQTP